MLDTHCHLNDKQYDNDMREVIDNFFVAGVEKVICVGWDVASSERAKEISNEYKNIYYAVGVHPDNCQDFDGERIENILKSGDKKLKAVGEIGLDYFHNKDNKSAQIAVFKAQIELANKYSLPIIIHCREAYGDCLDILKSYYPLKHGAVMHCYSGSLETANELIKLGVKLSFTGSVTFKNAKNLKEVAKTIPLESFFFETDSPYLTPEPYRGTRNEPKFVFEVARCVADLRGMDVAELIAITDKNATEFFNLKA